MKRGVLVPVMSVAIAACAGDSQKSVVADRLETLEAKLAATTAELSATTKEFESFRKRVDLDNAVKSLDQIAFLSPGDEGYAVVSMNLGRLAIILDNVQPYANGSRITLRIGNLTSATVTGMQATVEWGSVDSDGRLINESTNSREIAATQDLRPGVWTIVPVVLERTAPADLGFVRVRNVMNTGIRLHK